MNVVTKKHLIYTIILLSCWNTTTFSQTIQKVDSLIAQSKKLHDKNTDSALLFANRALKIVLAAKDKAKEGEVRNQLAWVYYRKSDFSNCFFQAFYALKINDSLKNFHQLAISYSNLGAAYNSQNQNDTSLKYFKKAFEYFDKVKDIEGVGRSLNNIAFINSKLGNTSEALSYCKKALAHNVQLNNQYYYAFGLRVMGDIYMYEKEWEKAIYYLDSSYKVALKNNNVFLQISSLYKLGYCHKIINQNQKALYYLNKSIQLSNQYGSFGELDKSYSYASEIYAQLGDFKKAYEYATFSRKLRDSLSLDEDKRKIAEVKAKYELEKKESEINKLKALEATQKNKVYIQRTIGIVLLFIAAFIGILFFTQTNRNRVINKINKELHERTLALEQATQLLHQKNKELQNSVQLKDKIFSVISHDLRSPLATLTGMVQLMEQNLISAKDFKQMQIGFSKQLFSLNTTLDNLLQWSKNQITGIDKSKNFGPVNVRVIAENNINLYEEIAKNKLIKIINHCKNEHTVYGDFVQIDIVIRNLLSNAIKFTPKDGLIYLSTKEYPEKIEILVKDTGKGIPEQKLNNLFSYQFNSSTPGTNNERGTGLGLILCKELIENNNGHITVHSEIDKGTTFILTFPKAKMNEQEKQA